MRSAAGRRVLVLALGISAMIAICAAELWLNGGWTS
jgi:hypothetical protein